MFMNIHDLEMKYREFKKVHAEDEQRDINLGEFIFKSPEFEKIDIVFFNRWKFSEEEFMVPVLLRKKTIMSKQEERKAGQKPEYIQKQIDNEANGLKAAKVALEEVMKEVEMPLLIFFISGKTTEMNTCLELEDTTSDC